MNGKSRPMGGSQTLAKVSVDSVAQAGDATTESRRPGYVTGLDGKPHRGRQLQPGERADLAGYVHHLATSSA
jgi:hypothetical protein